MKRRVIKETVLDDNREPIQLPTGGTIEFPEPAKLVQEHIEFTPSEAVLVQGMAQDKLRQIQEADAAQEAIEAQETRVVMQDESKPADPVVMAAHETAAAIDSFLQTVDKQQLETAEEVQRLIHLPLSEIEKLPPEKQQLVWEEMTRQLVETPGFLEGIQKLSEFVMQPVKNMDEITNGITRTLTSIGAAMDGIRKTLSEMFSADAREAMQTWATLAPYINAEAKEHPELYGEHAEEPASADELIAAAARRARADGKEIPKLRAEEPEQIEMQLEFPTKEGNQQQQPSAPAPIVLARSGGAITSLGGHVATIADKVLQFCFTSRDMKALPGEHDKFLFDSAGKLNEMSLNGQPLQPLDDIHTGFQMALLQAACMCDIREYNSKDNPSLGIHLPSFFRETHIDPRPREWDKENWAVKKRASEQTTKQLRLQRFIEFMKPLDNRVGIIEGEGYYTVARFISWDEKTDVAYIAIPYEIKLAEIARLHTDRHSAISTIFHADILTENQTAVELANRIAVGVIERGVTRSQSDTYKNKNPRKPIKKKVTTTNPDGSKTTVEETFAPVPEEKTITRAKTDENGITTTVTYNNPQPRIFKWESSFASIIADCPQLQKELDAIRRSSAKDKSQRVNKKLQDTFLAAIRIIMEKSDMPKYYAQLSITTGNLPRFKAPTNSTLKDKLTVTHKGKNPNYKE